MFGILQDNEISEVGELTFHELLGSGIRNNFDILTDFICGESIVECYVNHYVAPIVEFH